MALRLTILEAGKREIATMQAELLRKRRKLVTLMRVMRLPVPSGLKGVLDEF